VSKDENISDEQIMQALRDCGEDLRRGTESRLSRHRRAAVSAALEEMSSAAEVDTNPKNRDGILFRSLMQSAAVCTVVLGGVLLFQHSPFEAIPQPARDVARTMLPSGESMSPQQEEIEAADIDGELTDAYAGLSAAADPLFAEDETDSDGFSKESGDDFDGQHEEASVLTALAPDYYSLEVGSPADFRQLEDQNDEYSA
jgi:hypothetical protein